MRVTPAGGSGRTERTVAGGIRLSVVDLVRRVAVVSVVDDGSDELPHVLRGTLAGLLGEPGWHVVAAFDPDGPARSEVSSVLDQATVWADERGAWLSVTPLRDIGSIVKEQ